MNHHKENHMTNYPILYNEARLWANPNDVEDSALSRSRTPSTCPGRTASQ